MNTATRPTAASSVLSMNPWLSIWTRPKQTVRHIVTFDPEHYVLTLAFLWGVNSALNRVVSNGLGDQLGLPAIFGLSALGGVIGGILTLYLAGFMVRWTGQWMGGERDSGMVRTAIAWSTVPIAFGLALWIPQLAVEGHSVFMSEANKTIRYGRSGEWLTLAVAMIKLILVIWWLVLLVKCVAEVQGFSAWKALGNLLLAWGIFLLAIFIPVYIFAIPK